MRRMEWIWALCLSLFQWLWLWGWGFAGYHGKSLLVIQLLISTGLLLLFSGFLASQIQLRRREPELTFFEGIRSGAVIAILVAALSVLIQWGYHRRVNPDWTRHMIELSLEYYRTLHPTVGAEEELREQAALAYGLRSSLIQSGITPLSVGIFASALVHGVSLLRKKR